MTKRKTPEPGEPTNMPPAGQEESLVAAHIRSMLLRLKAHLIKAKKKGQPDR
jgi:hypothetical protein